MEPKIINKFGTLLGFNATTVNLLGRDIEGFTEVEYSDEMEINNEYGAGKYPIGQSEGNYSAKASIAVFAEEVVALQKSLPKGKRIQEIAPFDISVVYEFQGRIMKDVIRNCRFKNNGRVVKQNDGKIIHKFEIITTHIEYDV